MKNSIWLSACLVLMMIFAAIAPNALADQKYTYNYSIDNYRGLGARFGQIIISVSDTLGVRYEYSNRLIIIYSAATGDVFILYPEAQEYTKVNYLSLNDYKESIESDFGDVPFEREEVAGTVKVKNWNALRYKFTIETDIFDMVSTVFLSTEIAPSLMLDEYYAELASLQGTWGKLLENIRNLPGVVVKRVDQIEYLDETYSANMELVSFEETPIPATMFGIPNTYSKVDISTTMHTEAFIPY